MTEPCLVRETSFFRKPLQLMENDGSRRAPPGGILLHAIKREDYTRFPSRQDAEEAIVRTVLWGAEQGYGWKPTDYETQSVAAYEEERSAPHRRCEARKTAAKAADGTEGHNES